MIKYYRYPSVLAWLLLGCLLFWGLVFSCHVWATPYLTCDCTPSADAVTGFQLQFGVQPVIDIPAVDCVPAVTDGKRILYDLGTMPQGAFSVKALAKNSWGVSDWTAPLAGTKKLPSSPLLLRIIP